MLERKTGTASGNFEKESERSADPHLYPDKPGRLSEVEVVYLLERGAYLARLRAAQKLSSVTLAFAQDIDTKDFIIQKHVQALTLKVAELSKELAGFDSEYEEREDVATEDEEPEIPIEEDSSLIKIPLKIGITEDFTKRRESAICAETDPEIFFPEKGGSTREAKKVCLSCEIRDECLNYALENNERFGIWGGLSERERRKLLKKAV